MWQYLQKGTTWGANLDFEFCIWSECALLPLYSALYCASVAGSVSEIYLRSVWNYEKCVVEKTTFTFWLIRNIPYSSVSLSCPYSVIINLGQPSSLATCRFTGLSERPPKLIVLTQAIHAELQGPKGQRDLTRIISRSQTAWKRYSYAKLRHANVMHNGHEYT